MLHLSIPRRRVMFRPHDYTLRTDVMGDTTARFVISRHGAAYMRSTDIGDEVIVWDDTTTRMVWRGQIEAITQQPDSSVELSALGLGRLVGDIPISTVLNDTSTARWEVAPRAWIDPSSYLPNPDRWEQSKNQYLIITARQGETYDANQQAMWVYRFQDPERYRQITSHRLDIVVTELSGIIAISGLVVGILINPEPPYIPVPYTSITAPGSYVITGAYGSGWFISTSITTTTTEITTGNSRAVIRATVHPDLRLQTFHGAISTHLADNHVPIFVMLDPSISPTSSVAVRTTIATQQTLASLFPIVTTTTQTIVLRMLRDIPALLITRDDPSEPPYPSWRITTPMTISRDYAHIPSYVVGRWQDSSGIVHTIVPSRIDPIAERRVYARWQDLAVMTSHVDATSHQNSVVAAYTTLPLPSITITISHNRPSILATARGTVVPPWSAEPGEGMMIDAALTTATIVSREITSSATTYTVAIPQPSFASLVDRAA